MIKAITIVHINLKMVHIYFHFHAVCRILIITFYIQILCIIQTQHKHQYIQLNNIVIDYLY